MARKGSGVGFTLTNGYKRVKRRGPYRDWVEHRMIVDLLTREWSFYGPGIPPGFHVHHVDFCGVHNCPNNLLMIQAELHDGTSSDTQPIDPDTGRFMTRRKLNQLIADAPEWVREDI